MKFSKLLRNKIVWTAIYLLLSSTVFGQARILNGEGKSSPEAFKGFDEIVHALMVE